jgi:hypothetical protein
VLYRANTAMGILIKSLAAITKCFMAHTACPFTLKGYTYHLDKLRDPKNNVSEDNISKTQTSTFQTKEA